MKRKNAIGMLLVTLASSIPATGMTVYAEEAPVVALTMPTAYDAPDTDEVEEAINQIIEEKYGVKIDLQLINVGNWQQQSNLMLTGDEADIIAVYQTPLQTYVNNNQLLPLDDYYENASEEFKAVWSEDALQGTSSNGTLYAIPNVRNYGGRYSLNIDEKIAEEFGIEEMQPMTMEDIDEFLYKVHEKYPDRYAIAPNGTALISINTTDGLGDFGFIGVVGNCGQNDEVISMLDDPNFQMYADYAYKWYQDGLTMMDIMSNTEAWQTLILSGKAVSVIDSFGVNGLNGMIRTQIVGPWNDYGESYAWCDSNSYSGLCYAINANCKDKDAAWKMMEILYTDADVEILINNGIEGKHYVKNEDGSISFPEGKDASSVGYPMSELYWITPYASLSYPLDQNGPDFYKDLEAFNASTLKSKAFGFTFDAAPVIDQWTACLNVMSKYRGSILAGVVDPAETIAKANQELEAAGIETVIAEKQRQLDEFYAAQSVSE